MMKKFWKMSLWAFLPVLLLAACSDDEKPEPPPGDVTIEEIINELESITDVEDFTTALKQYSPSLNIGEQKLTVLAAKSFSAGSSRSSDGNAIERHLVKGVHDFSAMTSDTLMVTTITGEELYVIKADENTILVNGIPLISIEQKKAGESVIYVISAGIPSTVEYVKPKPYKYSISFNVLECNEEWTPENNQSAFPSSGAVITIYREINDDPVLPVYYEPLDSLETDANGKVVYQHNYDEGVYYTASNGDKKHLYGYYLPKGVYTSQAEVDNGPNYNTGISEVDDKKPGTLILADLNGDNVINEQDQFTSGYIGVEANEEVTLYLVDQKAQITPSPVITLESLRQLKIELDTYFQSFVANADSVDFRLMLPNVIYPGLSNFSESEKLWSAGYAYINKYILVQDLLNRSGNPAELMNEWTEDYRAKFAYVYVVIVTYWGDAILITEPSMNPIRPRNTKAEIIDYLEAMMQNISSEYVGAFKALLARYYANEKDFARAQRYAKEVVNSGKYELAVSPFASASNKEVILGGLAVKNSSHYRHPVRYSEVLLTLAESLIEQGNLDEALQYINTINKRNGNPEVQQVTSQSEMREIARNVWKDEFDNEGLSFMLINRWGLLLELLGKHGAHSHNNLLPIPPTELQINVEMSQNPGY